MRHCMVSGRMTNSRAHRPYRGVFPVAPTIFDDRGALDLDGQGRALECMIDQGIDGICILANYSEQFVLDDEERETLTRFCLERIGGRVPVIVTCSHFSTRIAVERARLAARLGADMLMLMPPYHGATLRADERGMIEHFQRVAEAANIPIMVQDAPLSGVTLNQPGEEAAATVAGKFDVTVMACAAGGVPGAAAVNDSD